MRRKTFCVALLVGLWILLPGTAQLHADDQSVKLPPKEKFFLFLLAGQSNMAGRGVVSEEDRTPHPRVLMLNQQNQWVPAADPVHFDKPKVAGTGLGKTFGMIIAETNPDITVGLIPCAVGGTPIDRWEPGAEDSFTKTHPWDDCMTRIKPALEVGTLKGILWHQGEGDANPQRAPYYLEKLTSLVRRFRQELGDPQVPFVLGQLGQFEGRPWTNSTRQVDQAMHDLVKQVPRTALVSSEGLRDKGDHVHFDSAAYRELGKRYAEAYLKILSLK